MRHSVFVFPRVTWIVLDSVGIGAMPDAGDYGDTGSDTLGNIVRVRGLHLPNLCAMGLGSLKPMEGLPPAALPTAAYGRCALASPGKDTTTGHWEMAGIHLDRPFRLFPQGFPPALIEEFGRRSGRAVIGNRAASGTEIIEALGAEHIRTGSLIVYTSADSVFQIAAHEDVVPVWELYRACEIARELCRGDYEVGRVIARPFTGTAGNFVRTSNRKDYAVPPPRAMLLDQLNAARVPVFSVGKIFDVFMGRGIQDHIKTKNNADGMRATSEALTECKEGLVFTNLVDFDQNFGHRNDVDGYAAALEEFDAWLPGFVKKLDSNDLLIITADHGCDPTTASTDHSREYVPLLAYRPRNLTGVDLGTRDTLSDIGQTVAENFGTQIAKGISFLSQL